MDDKYQTRYLEHQARKKEILQSNYGNWSVVKHEREVAEIVTKVVKSRVSQRAFNRVPVENIDEIVELASQAPSSCNRKGVEMKVVESRDDKDLLSGLLVGGVGWCHRADKIILLVANEIAYKSPAEKGVMWYLDAGVLIQNLYLILESRNIGACYINPNIRASNYEFFKEKYLEPDQVFCGAMAIGNYDMRHAYPTD